mmetsp:Transcript_27678/g.63977  ORF Transcript_27678/g.63977 Transcript_27678/m.63977 type:complete len:238 (-) Transcript_27678:1376-2089(-)
MAHSQPMSWRSFSEAEIVRLLQQLAQQSCEMARKWGARRARGQVQHLHHPRHQVHHLHQVHHQFRRLRLASGKDQGFPATLMGVQQILEALPRAPIRVCDSLTLLRYRSTPCSPWIAINTARQLLHIWWTRKKRFEGETLVLLAILHRLRNVLGPNGLQPASLEAHRLSMAVRQACGVQQAATPGPNRGRPTQPAEGMMSPLVDAGQETEHPSKGATPPQHVLLEVQAMSVAHPSAK